MIRSRQPSAPSGSGHAPRHHDRVGRDPRLAVVPEHVAGAGVGDVDPPAVVRAATSPAPAGRAGGSGAGCAGRCRARPGGGPRPGACRRVGRPRRWRRRPGRSRPRARARTSPRPGPRPRQRIAGEQVDVHPVGPVRHPGLAGVLPGLLERDHGQVGTGDAPAALGQPHDVGALTAPDVERQPRRQPGGVLDQAWVGSARPDVVVCGVPLVPELLAEDVRLVRLLGWSHPIPSTACQRAGRLIPSGPVLARMREAGAGPRPPYRVRAPGGTRTHNQSLLRRLPLPVGIRGPGQRRAAALPSTSSSIGAVSRPVKVFCWLGW